MGGEIVGHWQHGEGILVRDVDEESALVLFEDNKERVILKANLTDESGLPLIARKVIGRPDQSLLEGLDLNKRLLYEYIRRAGRPVFTDYPSAPALIQVLKSEGATIGSAGTLSSLASQLHKREGLIDYAGGVRGSGWVVAK